jgi:hypothetical protein
MIHGAAVVAGRAAIVGIAIESERVRILETAGGTHASEKCAREEDTRGEGSPKRMYVIH